MSIEAVTARVDALVDDISDVKSTLKAVDNKVDNIGQALVLLARLEERHANTQDKVSGLEKTVTDNGGRIGALEKVVPGLVETRGWVVTGLLAGVGMIGIAVVKLVLLT